MEAYIDKSTYLEYLNCPKNIWLKMRRPELLELFELSEFEKNLSKTGKLVEELAAKMFPQGEAIKRFGEQMISATRRHMEQKTPVLLQPTFLWEDFLCRCDILVYDAANDAWNLQEIKATNSFEGHAKEIDFMEDVTFQAAILTRLGIKLGKIFLVHLNKDYVRGEELELNELFISEDIADEVFKKIPATWKKMRQTRQDLLNRQEEEVVCQCLYLGRSAQCTTFKYSHPEVPDYSVHDLYRIGLSPKKLLQLVRGKTFDLKNIPRDFSLSDIQQNQLRVYLEQRPLLNRVGLKAELDKLVYPLYFLDFESYASAIPLWPGFSPYQQIPFQFSLYVASKPGAEPEEYGYLHEGDFDPSVAMIEELKEFIGPIGSIIVWNKSFESKIHTELAVRHPEHRKFLDDLNFRIFDLMDIFRKQIYVHPDARGKNSLKSVLPALVPELSYKNLEIQEGATACQRWFEMVFGQELVPSEKEKIVADLLKYCSLDTYAMYAIWKHLREKI